jgi:hypothetical protein
MCQYQQDPFWEANSSAAGHKNSPNFMETEGSLLCSQESATCPYILNQVNPVHSLPSRFFKIQCKIIFSSAPRSSKWSHSFRFSHQTSVCISLFPYVCHEPRPSHFPWIHEPSNIWRGVQIGNLIIMTFSSATGCFLPLRSRYVCYSLRVEQGKL